MRPDDDADPNVVLWHMGMAAEKGKVDVFNVLLKQEESKLEDEDWQVFISDALLSNKLDILSLDKMKLAISAMSAQDISNNLEST